MEKKIKMNDNKLMFGFKPKTTKKAVKKTTKKK